MAPSVSWLIGARILQAIGEAAGGLADAILMDVSPNMEVRSASYAKFMCVGVLSMTASPFLGGIIGSWLGWRYIFYIMCGLATILLCLAFAALPETARPQALRTPETTEHAEKKGPMEIYSANFCWLTIMIAAMLLNSGQAFGMLSTWPYILHNAFQMDEMGCSFVMGGFALASFAGVVLCVACEGTTLWKRAQIGLAFVFIAGLLFANNAAAPQIQLIKLSTLIMPQVIYMFGMPLADSCLKSMYMEPFGDHAGFMAGVINFLIPTVGVLESILSVVILDKLGISAVFAFYAIVLITPQMLFFGIFGSRAPSFVGDTCESATGSVRSLGSPARSPSSMPALQVAEAIHRSSSDSGPSLIGALLTPKSINRKFGSPQGNQKL